MKEHNHEIPDLETFQELNLYGFMQTRIRDEELKVIAVSDGLSIAHDDVINPSGELYGDITEILAIDTEFDQ